MRVHIIAAETTSDQILARLARTLAEATGWSLGVKPDSKADVNYYLPYLLVERHADPGTKRVGWFTHRDTSQPGKAAHWDKAAKLVDLRLCSAKMYLDGLAKCGPAGYVTPPLDPQFTPGKRKKHSKPVIGFSGYVYRGGRKGEVLAKALMAAFPTAEFVASGKGWPCRTKEYAWKDVPGFYRSLDLYVCTASIEGVGYPPLEALACGVSVVVPSGVGVFDELPKLRGIFRYAKGDAGSLLKAVERALLEIGDVEPEKLKAATERFTVEAWANDHRRAFEELLGGKPDVISDGLDGIRVSQDEVFAKRRTRPSISSIEDGSGIARRNAIIQEPPNSGRGIYCVAYGGPSRDCAEKLIASIRKHMPGLPVALVSDSPLGCEDVFIEQPEADVGARSQKTRIWELAPAEWRYILYLDSDTELVAPITSLFQILEDGWDVLFCPNPDKYVLGQLMVRPDNKNECDETFRLVGTHQFIQLNGGVFGFQRNERTERFLTGWHRRWNEHGKRDQAALDRELYSNPLHVWIMSSHHNRVDRYDQPTYQTAIVHHPTKARRWTGRIGGRSDSREAWMVVHPERGEVAAR